MTDPSIIPRPVSCLVSTEEGPWIDSTCPIIAGIGSEPEAQVLANELTRILGRRPTILTESDVNPAQPCLILRRAKRSSHCGEEYLLSIDATEVIIEADSPAGVFYGIQTLLQLFPVSAPAGYRLPALAIEDRPRFPWRGVMLDTVRHFIPVDDILRFIDVMAHYRLNRLHLHLTDDQGWRLEIRRYPLLTRIGGWRRETLVGHQWLRPQLFDGIPHGGFYTQSDIRRIISHAQSRHVVVIPEIEMPGHAQAAIAAYPWLGNNGKPCEVRTQWGVNPHIFNAEERTVRFLEDVLAEVTELFPSPWIHIGGDEAPKDEWIASPAAQKRAQTLGLRSVHDLQSWIVGRIGQFLSTRGRTLIGWDEIADGNLPANAVIMSWRGFAGGITAIAKNRPAIMCPESYTYLDHYQHADPRCQPQAIGTTISIENVYAFEPIPAGTPDSSLHLIMGGQAQLWSEYIPDARHLELMAFPRLCAFAEALWSPREMKDFANFTNRLDDHLPRLDARGVNRFRPPQPDVPPAYPRHQDQPVLIVALDDRARMTSESQLAALERLAHNATQAGFCEILITGPPSTRHSMLGSGIEKCIGKHLRLQQIDHPTAGPPAILAAALLHPKRPCGIAEMGIHHRDRDLVELACMLARADSTGSLVVHPARYVFAAESPESVTRCIISDDGYDLLLGAEEIRGSGIVALSDEPICTGLWGLQPRSYGLLSSAAANPHQSMAEFMLKAQHIHGWQIRCSRIFPRTAGENP